MNILIIGDDVNFDECQKKFGETHFYTLTSNQTEAKKFFSRNDVVFDFCIDQNPALIEVYKNQPNLIAFFNTAKISLSKLSDRINHRVDCTWFGFAGLPTFLNRELLEVSLYDINQKSELEEICRKLGTQFQLVEDRVGLVTPRVIGMIINEAFYTVEDDTATREDIDLAMKLGTNYPFGPFEWCKKIGARHVCELLEAVYKDTLDERYQICPLLNSEAK